MRCLRVVVVKLDVLAYQDTKTLLMDKNKARIALRQIIKTKGEFLNSSKQNCLGIGPSVSRSLVKEVRDKKQNKHFTIKGNRLLIKYVKENESPLENRSILKTDLKPCRCCLIHGNSKP